MKDKKASTVDGNGVLRELEEKINGLLETLPSTCEKDYLTIASLEKEIIPEALAAAYRLGATSVTATRLERKYRKVLTRLTNVIIVFEAQLAKVMEGPSTPERGKKIAWLVNFLERNNDLARYATLGVDFRKDNKERALKKALRALKIRVS